MNKYINQEEQHPAAESLLLAIEGELQENEALSVADHLTACWKCRTESEEMRKGIFAFMEYRNTALTEMPPPPAGWRRFESRLNEATKSVQSSRPALHFLRMDSAWANLQRILRPLRGDGSVPALVATAFVIIALALIPLTSRKNGPSAQDILSRALASRNAVVARVRNAGIRQEVQIQSGHLVAVRVLHYRADQVASVQTTSGSVRTQNLLSLEALKKTFAVHRIPWDTPLDVLSLSDRNGGFAGAAGHPAQVRTDASGFVTLILQSPREPELMEHSVTLRTADWHPVEQRWRFADGTGVEVKELSFEIRDEPSLYTAQNTGVSRTTARPTESSLLRSEVMARAAMHGIGADLGDPIDFYRTKSGSIRVQGIATSEQRREELMTALKGLPYVQVRLEMLSSGRPRRATQQLGVASGVPGGSVPALEELLAKNVSDQEERRELVNHVLRASQESLLRAWALRKLAERYSPPELKRLDNASVGTIRSLLSDHLADLRRQLSLEQEAVSRFANEVPEKQRIVKHSQLTAWQDSVLELFADVSKLDSSWTAALVGSNGTPTNGAQAANILSQRCRDVATDIERVDRDIAMLPAETVKK
jgi:hypothetical protein